MKNIMYSRVGKRRMSHRFDCVVIVVVELSLLFIIATVIKQQPYLVVAGTSNAFDESTTKTSIIDRSIVIPHHDDNEILRPTSSKNEDECETTKCDNSLDNNNGYSYYDPHGNTNNIYNIDNTNNNSNNHNNIIDVSTSNSEGFITQQEQQHQQQQQRNLQTIDPNCATRYDYSTIACTSLSVFTGGAIVFSSRLVIPCGQCITIPTTTSTNYTFYDGIDIQGKLSIDCDPTTASTSTTQILQTTSIIVQGQFNIDARCKSIITGIPLVQIVMISKADLSFTTFLPINSIVQGHCNTITGCNIGEKSITVAGGTVNFYGLPGLNPDTVPTWVNLYDVIYQNNNASLPVTAIILNDMNIATTWGVGATIIITSFTSTWNQFQQVRSIQQVIPNYNSGLVTLVLNSTITRPTTIVDDPNYAVEVALLSRNIQFTSIPNGRNNTVGGHLWIFFTPDQYQLIQGVDIHQFGQQGLLGRYPIHFHHCSNVTTGTTISKNTIRRSFQRCVVIHGTNNVLISNNVAYDTAGHCYMLEDGIEMNNIFERNLGIMTKNPVYIIPNTTGANNGDESDGSCSTFWITNTQNIFSNNVVAGSQDSGYWFQLLKRGIFVTNYPNLIPKGNTLLYFQNNVAHSTGSRGIRTYSSGYNPVQTARMVGLRIYRNARTGVFFRRSSNIEVADSLVADNGIAFSFQRSSATIRLTNVTIIGETNNFRTNVRLRNYGTVCYNYNKNGSNIGIEPRTYTNYIGSTAYRFDNVRFSGFNHNNCSYVFPISFDFNPTDGEYIFVGYSTMNTLSFADNNPISIDYCRVTNYNITNVYVTDIDGTLKPTAIPGVVTAPATIVTLQPSMLQFVDPSKCTSVPSQCLSYCQDTCFRAILLEVEPVGTTGYQVQICQSSNPTNCIVITGLWSPKRWFPAYLPIGDYTAQFIDDQGQPVFPTYVRQIMTDAACPKPGNVSITIIEPPVTIASCVQLLRNGNLDASSVSPLYWYSQGKVDLRLLSGAGMDGSNALGSYPNDTQPTFVQFLDTRCWKFMVGSYYQLSAQLKLLTTDGQVYLCNKTVDRCPRLGITMDTLPNVSSTFKVAEGAINTGTTIDFQTIAGTFRITPDLLNRTGMRFFIQAYNYQLIADNLSMSIANYTSPTPSPSKSPELPCSNMVENSDLEQGYKGYWTPEMFGSISQVRPGYNSNTALKYTKMLFRQAGPRILASAIDFSCMTAATTKWVVTVRVKIIGRGSRNTGASCDVTNTCPAVVIRIRNTNGELIVSHTTRSYTSKTWDPNGFNLYSDTIDLPTDPTWITQIQKINIGFGNFPPQWELIWDDFAIQPL